MGQTSGSNVVSAFLFFFFFFFTSQMIKISSLSCDYSVIRPQMEGRAPVTSSAAATEPASRENTNATTWKTAWTGLTRDPAVSRPRGGSLCCVLDLSLPWHFNQFVEIKRLVD